MAAESLKEAVTAALAVDGRASVEALGRSLGLSSSSVRRAMADLAADGISVHAVVHPAVLDLHTCAHLRLQVGGEPAAVVEALVARDDVPFVSLVAGSHAVAAEIRTADRAALATAVAEIALLDGVIDVRLDEYLDIVKDAGLELPAATTAASLDEIDRIIVAELQADGRRSFAAMADLVGLTTASTRSRVLRLIDAGALRIGVRRRPGPGTVQIGFSASAPGARAVARDSLMAMPELSYLAIAVGAPDIVGTLTCSSVQDAATALARLRRVVGVRTLEAWTHLEVVKESYVPPAGTAGAKTAPRTGERNRR
jgi:DNA-binding Lrp family transcriptional regulator